MALARFHCVLDLIRSGYNVDAYVLVDPSSTECQTPKRFKDPRHGVNEILVVIRQKPRPRNCLLSPIFGYRDPLTQNIIREWYTSQGMANLESGGHRGLYTMLHHNRRRNPFTSAESPGKGEGFRHAQAIIYSPPNSTKHPLYLFVYTSPPWSNGKANYSAFWR